MEIKKEAIRGVKWTSLSTGLTVIIQLIQTAILARILSPEDYGLMALANIAMGFISIFLDMGISYAIISKPHITHQQLSSLYWLNIITGILLFVILSSASPLVAAFYDEQELTPIIIITSITFISSGFSIQYYALLSKELKFDILSKIAILTQGTGFLISVILAFNGFKIYSLVYAYLFSSLFNSLLLIYFGRKYHVPSFYYSFQEIKEFISFGSFQIGERTLNYFNSQFDSLIIGKVLGPGMLGFYTLAKNLTIKPIDIINPIITKVTIPIMSKVSSDTNYLGRIYKKTLEYLCSINFPIYALFFILAEPIILVLYGAKWTEAIHFFRLLSLYFLIRTTFNPIGSLLIARGKANWAFYWNLSFFTIMPVAIWLGSFWGVSGVIFALIILFILGIYPLYRYLISTLISISFSEYIKVITAPLVPVFFSGIVCSFFIQFPSEALYQLILGSSIFGLVYIFLIYSFNRSLFQELISFKNK
ncbi:MOP flippase family protein [Pontibacter toksunensis]|uniref:MOP flippase family protein n=1 Tax=Pontibacter toksunensis TaxID=1332631 RepID=A0ABW6BPI5_9BACT